MYASARDLRRQTAAMYAPPADISVSDAISELLVTPSGPYLIDLVPYMRKPADSLGRRKYRVVAFAGPGRCSKTATLVDGWTAYNRKYAPGDQLNVMGSEFAARAYSKFRFDKILKASPKLRELMSPRRADDNTYDKVFKAGDVVAMGWPSGSQLSMRDFVYVAVTEYDLAADDVEGEGSLFALGLVRIQTAGSAGKMMVESSIRRTCEVADWEPPPGQPHMAPPATGLTGIYNAGTRNWFYWRCPCCRRWFPLNPDVHVMFHLPPLEELVEQLDDVEPMEWARSKAMVRCPWQGCGVFIEESLRPALNAAGVWVPCGCTVTGDGEVIGAERKTHIDSYQLSCVAAAYASWADILGKLATAIQHYRLTGSESEIKSTVNLDQGRVYTPLAILRRKKDRSLETRTEDWPQQFVPAGVHFLTAQIDIQAGKRPRFVIQVHGVGPYRERWIVDRYALKSSARPTGKVIDGEKEMHPLDPSAYPEDWDRLIEKVINRRYLLNDGSGRSLPIQFVVCDSGGKAGVTRQAYQFFRRLREKGLHTKFRLYKGASREGVATMEERYPDARKRADRKSGAAKDVPVLLTEVGDIKDTLDGDLKRETPGPGYYHFPAWLPKSFYQELKAETRGANGWSRKSGQANESVDLCVMGEIALIALGADKERFWRAPPAWARTWDDNPHCHAGESAAPAPVIARRGRGTRSTGVSI